MGFSITTSTFVSWNSLISLCALISRATAAVWRNLQSTNMSIKALSSLRAELRAVMRRGQGLSHVKASKLSQLSVIQTTYCNTSITRQTPWNKNQVFIVWFSWRMLFLQVPYTLLNMLGTLQWVGNRIFVQDIHLLTVCIVSRMHKAWACREVKEELNRTVLSILITLNTRYRK